MINAQPIVTYMALTVAVMKNCVSNKTSDI